MDSSVNIGTRNDGILPVISVGVVYAAVVIVAVVAVVVV